MNEIQQILSGIKGGRYGFPAAQRLVADYVVKNYEQIPFLSITALAQNCGVSEKTAKICTAAGANVLVAGSAYFKSPDKAAFVRALKG